MESLPIVKKSMVDLKRQISFKIKSLKHTLKDKSITSDNQ